MASFAPSLLARGTLPGAAPVPTRRDPDAPAPPADDAGNGGGGPNRWVTIATFWASPPAHLARLRLESDGIPAVLLDEHVTSFCYTFAFGGIKLQVPDDRAAEARRVLDAGEAAGDGGGDGGGDGDDPADAAALDAFVAAHGPSPDDLDGEGEQDGSAAASCPACGGRSESAGYDRLLFAGVLLLPLLTLGRWGVPAYLAALAVAFAFVRPRARPRCDECDPGE